MTIKQIGGVFGRNPEFNDVEVTGELDLPDGVVASFGDNKDFQIVHDGSHTYLTDGGDGNVYFRTNSQFNITATNGAVGLQFNPGVNVALRHNNALVFSTTNNGAAVYGNLTMATAGGGIDFSATSGTGTSELFDDYEEGTWTPDPQDSSGNSGSAGTASGYYTKIGNVVFATVLLDNIDTTGLTAGQDFRIYGLPYTSASLVGNQIFTGAARMNNVTFSGNPNLAILDSTDYIRIVESISGSASDFVVVSEIASGTADIYGTITYMAA